MQIYQPMPWSAVLPIQFSHGIPGRDVLPHGLSFQRPKKMKEECVRLFAEVDYARDEVLRLHFVKNRLSWMCRPIHSAPLVVV